jgi:50S ribosomal protein L16 3-hydroxylase
MTAPLGELTTEAFLKDYWQKKPCLVRQAIPGYVPPLDANDLAGLAMEEMAESRLVSGSMQSSDWKLAYGPFRKRDYSALPAENWTLLVQDVEKHYVPVQELLNLFRFIPGWRLDDLMISYAVKGGSVGPHVDQYDVFLFQAEGRRHWQIAESFNPALRKDCPLNILESFSMEQEWVLEPGDLLYLPANVAHHGVALEPCMTWSIGARAPSAADLLQAYGEWLAGTETEGGRYSDPPLQPVHRPGEIDRAALARLKQFMLAAVDADAGVDEFLAQFLSRFRQAHEPAAPPQLMGPQQLLEIAGNNLLLMKNPWTRLVWIERNGRALLFASGESFTCSIALAEALCGDDSVQIDKRKLDSASLESICGLVNGGHFIPTSKRA